MQDEGDSVCVCVSDGQQIIETYVMSSLVVMYNMKATESNRLGIPSHNNDADLHVHVEK